MEDQIVSDPKHLVNKITMFLDLINKKRIISTVPAEETFICKNATPSFKPPTEEEYQWEPIDCKKAYEFGHMKRAWLAFKGIIQKPTNFDPNESYLKFSFPVERHYDVRTWDDNSPAGPEGRFWINNQLIAAIDEFHDGIRISPDLISTPSLVEVRLYTGRCSSHHILQNFCVQQIHKPTEILYQKLRFYLTVVKELDQSSLDRHRLLSVLDKTIRVLNVQDCNRVIPLLPNRTHDPTSALFYSSVPESLKVLEEGLKTFPESLPSDPSVNVIGYSHLDTCWLWPFSLTHFKFANTSSTMLHLQENYNCKWKFLGTASQIYKWIKKDDKKLYDRILQAAKEGKWEVNGAMWLEPDTTILNGESLCRQLLYGMKFMEKEMGFKQTVCVVPDCFGFTASLPQILSKSGINYFITAKISWCEYTKFPFDTFKWKGIDGTEIISHYITTPSAWDYQTTTYTGVSTAYELIGTYKHYKQKNILPQSALHTSGNGDGGGGITEEMCWNLELMDNLPKIEGVPRLKFPTLTELFQKIEEKRDHLPVWDDELYLEYHRGTLTSQEENKRQNRVLEAHLHNSEALLTILSALSTENIQKEIKEIQNEIESVWENTLLFQFHDALPGSSINEANIEILMMGLESLNQIISIENKIALKLKKVLGSENSIAFNTLSHLRNEIPSFGWKEIPQNLAPKVDGINTTHFELDVNSSDANDKFIEHVREHKSLSTMIEPSTINFDQTSKTVSTPHLTVKFNENGEFVSIKSNQSGREFLTKSKTGKLEFYEDRPYNWPAWDIQLYHKEMQLPDPKLISFDFNENSLILKFQISNNDQETEESKTIITEIIKFSLDEPIFDIKFIVNWTQHDKLLKFALPTNIRAKNANYGIQFGHISRPTHSNTDRDMAKFEVSGRWADLSDANSGISICSDVKCGFDIHEGNMKISLLKAPMQTDMWADFGKRKFTVRVFVHEGILSNRTIELSDDLNTPLVFLPNPDTDNITDNFAKIGCFIEETKNIIVETLKVAEEGDGFVLRAYEATGAWRKETLKFPLLKSNQWNVKLVSIVEKEISNGNKIKKDFTKENLEIEIELDAFEIATILFEPIH